MDIYAFQKMILNPIKCKFSKKTNEYTSVTCQYCSSEAVGMRISNRFSQYQCFKIDKPYNSKNIKLFNFCDKCDDFISEFNNKLIFIYNNQEYEIESYVRGNE